MLAHVSQHRGCLLGKTSANARRSPSRGARIYDPHRADLRAAADGLSHHRPHDPAAGLRRRYCSAMTNWTAADLPSFAERTVIITGANSGLGAVTARELARRGATIVMAVRDIRK